MNQELNCPRCEQAFDTFDRTPQMLPKCGHSLCLKCIREQTRIVCPEDGIPQPSDITLYPINQTILKIINRSGSKNSQLDSTELGETLRMSRCENFFEVIDSSFMCMEHHKRIELVCLDDYYKICVNCALFGNHKHHNVRNLDDVVQEIQCNLEESVVLMQQMQQKVKTLKQPLINKKIRDQIRSCIKLQQSQAEEQFKELITQIMMKQRKVMEEIEQRYKQIEEQLIKREQSMVSQVVEKADLWMLASQEKINQFSSQTEKGEIAFFLLTKDTSNQTAKQIINEIEEFMKNMQTRLQEVTQNCPPVMIGKDFGGFECNYPNVQQSYIIDDPNILRDVSMIDQSFLREIDDKPPHNEFLTPSMILPIQIQNGNQTISHSQSAIISQQSCDKRQPSQHEFVQSPKLLKRQSSMSPKRPQKKKLGEKSLQIIQNLNSDIIDLSQQDLGDDGVLLVEETLRNRKVKILKLMRNKISDTGAARLLELNVQGLHLQSNVITERFLDIILQSIGKGMVVQLKSIYLNQNLMNQFRVKKKLEELKKFGIIVQL